MHCPDDVAERFVWLLENSVRKLSFFLLGIVRVLRLGRLPSRSTSGPLETAPLPTDGPDRPGWVLAFLNCWKDREREFLFFSFLCKDVKIIHSCLQE